ncbi:MAG: hypothetical protein ABIC91_08345 [Nanoarchaeota archaeon]|nr:hypothetical protein [Nanoarchaeota archaeon]MBU1030353.1 hypothetical protein [Nanoarchaeota archaeon]MBU1849813.1 hypothetical protein [Nanoarchaeota archaeon]
MSNNTSNGYIDIPIEEKIAYKESITHECSKKIRTHGCINYSCCATVILGGAIFSLSPFITFPIIGFQLYQLVQIVKSTKQRKVAFEALEKITEQNIDKFILTNNQNDVLVKKYIK